MPLMAMTSDFLRRTKPPVSGEKTGGRGVWDLGPVTRGDAIHERMGQNLPRSFPVVDIFKDGIVTSIKSIDLQAPSYRKPGVLLSTVRRYIDKVAGFKSGRRAGAEVPSHKVRGRALDLGVPPGATAQQKTVFEQLRAYGTHHGVVVNIVELE